MVTYVFTPIVNSRSTQFLFKKFDLRPFFPQTFVTNKCMSLQSECNYGLDDAARFQNVPPPTRFASRTFLQTPARNPQV
jgi:hypothetical protein